MRTANKEEEKIQKSVSLSRDGKLLRNSHKGSRFMTEFAKKYIFRVPSVNR